MGSESVSFRKFAAVWYRIATFLEIAVRTIIMLVMQTFLFDMHLNWKPSDQFYQVSSANRLWLVNSVQLRNVLIVPTLLNRKLEEHFAPVRIWYYKSVDTYVCFTEFSCSCACHDEIIVVSLPCDPNAKSKARTTWLVAGAATIPTFQRHGDPDIWCNLR